MSFLEELRTRKAEGIKSKPVEGSGLPSNGTTNVDKEIGDKFETTYVMEPRFEGGQEELVKDEERKIIDRKHSEKALERIFKKQFTLKDYLEALYWRMTK